MDPRIILNSKQIELTINRLCYELIENHNDFKETVLVGLQPRGIYLSQRICDRLKTIHPDLELRSGNLDVTFYRDDFRRNERPLSPSTTEINFLVENQRVVLIDDVLYTGRTVRSGLDALMDFGRPKCVELLTLIDRRFSRHVPVQPDYTGRTIDAIISERVKVSWQETEGKDEVVLYTLNENNG